MFDAFSEMFTSQAALIAVALLFTLVIFIAFDGRKDHLGRLSALAHFCGVFVQAYVTWAALDSVVEANLQPVLSQFHWFRTLANVPNPKLIEPFTPGFHLGWPIEATLFLASMHISRLMWICIRPKESVNYLTRRPGGAGTPPSN